MEWLSQWGLPLDLEMSLFDRIWDCMYARFASKGFNGGVGFLVWMMDLVYHGFSKWHYEFTSKIGDKMAWEGIP